MKKKKRIIISSVILLLIIGISTFLILNKDGKLLDLDNGAVNWIGKQNTNNYYGNNSKGITIPGYDSLYLVAGEKQQKVNFYNPKENDCLFLLSLVVDDIAVWKSGYIEPGKGYYNIELTETFPAGEYSGYLYFQCYFSDGTELNSARVDFKKIIVR